MKMLRPQERELLLLSCLQQLLQGKITEGDVLRNLRKQVLGMSQEDYANLVGISRRTLSDIENDTGSQSMSVMNAAFKPFSIRIGLLPKSDYVLSQLLKEQK